MADTFEYSAELQLHDGSVVQVNLEERGWADPERLAQTRVFSLVPKTNTWPRMSVNIPEGAKPIFKSRNNVGMTAGWTFRSYAVGWFKDGESHWTWINPNGTIESETDDPKSTKDLILSLNDAWRKQVGGNGR